MWVSLEDRDGSGSHSPRRLLQLAARLGVGDPTRASAYLTRLQVWADGHAPTGCLTGRSPRTIAQAAGWRGDPATLLAALSDAGFLDRRPGGAWLRLAEPLPTPPSPGRVSETQPSVNRSPAASPATAGVRLHTQELWAAALRELQGMINEANFAAFLRDTVALYQSGGWLTVGVPSDYVQRVLTMRFRSAIERALYEVSGLPLRVRLCGLPPLPPYSA